ncbi:MAG: formate dehydrogenase subunit gamma [Alphaproteobacteria bacterium]|nr:formate dehydrogenase subunit gamma [Alphaproteobacteria bacterium]
MTAICAAARIALGALALVFFLASALPALAQQNAPIDPQARVQSEESLLKQFPRVEGVIDQPNWRERVLIQPDGRVWDHFHEVTLRWLGGLLIVGTLALLACAYLLLGRMRVSAGRSGIRILRFTSFERFSHWLTAASFVILGLTGLNITFGKVLLLPLIGPDAFSAFSQYAKYVHNYVSFSFVFGLAIIITIWMKDNIPEKADVEWFRQGGGFVKSRHAPARRFNAGEKLVYWLAFGAGGAVAVSGYLLLFPFYVTNIFGMQIAQGVHGIVALLFVALILGHIYIGTLGMEGAFEAMGTGEVDLNWAKEHHDLWLEDQLAKRQAGTSRTLPSATPAE